MNSSPHRLMSFRVVALAILVVVGLIFLYSAPEFIPEDLAWAGIGEDLEMLDMTVNTGPFLSSRVAFVRTGLKRYRVEVVRAQEFGWKRAAVKKLCRESKAVVGINANFFDEQGKPLGLVMSHGVVHQELHRGGKTLTGVFEVTRGGVAVTRRSEFDALSVLEAIQAGPRLLSNGKPLQDLREVSSSSRRAGVCIDNENRLVFYLAASGIGLSGVSIENLQRVLTHKDIGCKSALNLDGGGSAQLYVSEQILGAPQQFQEIELRGRDDVPVILGLVVREG